MTRSGIPRLILLLLLLMVLGFMAFRCVTFTLNITREYFSTGSTGEKDPMFPEEEGTAIPTEGPVIGDKSQSRDHSSEWILPEQVAVDKTADELIEEQQDCSITH